MDTCFKKLTPSANLPLLTQELRSVQALLTQASACATLDSPAASAFQDGLSNPGKLFRPRLVLGLAHLFGKAKDPYIHHIAAAVEILHTASLVLDDLPCMDDALLRRGKPSLHRQYGESQAILAAFGMISAANQLLLKPIGLTSSKRQVQVVSAFNRAFDVNGLVGGQSLDLIHNREHSPTALVKIHDRKTGALFQACGEMVTLWCQIRENQRQPALTFCTQLGLGFQLFDDMLDIAPVEVKGKRDANLQNQASMMHHLSEGQIKDRLATLRQEMCETLKPFGPSAGILNRLIDKSFQFDGFTA